jgi:hypothetical protein
LTPIAPIAVTAEATAMTRNRPRGSRTRVGTRIQRSRTAVPTVCTASSAVAVRTKRTGKPTTSSSVMCKTALATMKVRAWRRFRTMTAAVATALAVQMVGMLCVAPARNRL